MSKPEILLLRPIYAPTVAALERDYMVHKLWTAVDADAFIAKTAGNELAGKTCFPISS